MHHIGDMTGDFHGKCFFGAISGHIYKDGNRCGENGRKSRWRSYIALIVADFILLFCNGFYRFGFKEILRFSIGALECDG